MRLAHVARTRRTAAWRSGAHFPNPDMTFRPRNNRKLRQPETNEFSQGLVFESGVRAHRLSFASRWPRDGQEIGSGTGSSCKVSKRCAEAWGPIIGEVVAQMKMSLER
jgi:hypothetical protein